MDPIELLSKTAIMNEKINKINKTKGFNRFLPDDKDARIEYYIEYILGEL